MRFEGNFSQNISNASASGNKTLQADLVLDKVGELIKTHPDKVVSALQEAGISVSTAITKSNLVTLVTKSIYTSPSFRQELAILIDDYVATTEVDYSNAIGVAVAGIVTASLGALQGISQGIGSAVSSTQQTKQQKELTKQEEERTRQILMGKVFADNTKKNYMPIVVVGGALLVGTIVLIMVLRRKK